MAYLFNDDRSKVDIDDWLNEHPEAITSVADGSITDAKLSNTLKDMLAWDNELNKNLLVFTHAPQSIKWDLGVGNCFVLKTKSNKVVLFDLGEVATHDNIIQTMTDMGIDHIDYVIISHYHSDHVNEFQPISPAALLCRGLARRQKSDRRPCPDPSSWEHRACALR